MNKMSLSLHRVFAMYLETVMAKGIEDAEKNFPHTPQLHPRQSETDEFFNQYSQFLEFVRETYLFQQKLAQGDLSAKVSENNRLALPARELQATLQQLNTQTKRIADGDLEQRLNFFGDFSQSLNSLIETLKAKDELERKISYNENKLKIITSALGDGMLVVDQDAIITFCNPEAYKLLQVDEQDILGSPFHEFVHTKQADGSQLKVSEKFVLQTLNNKDTFRSDQVSFSRKDGKVIPVSVTCSPVIQNSSTTGAVISFRDISERKEYVESLEYINNVLKKQAMIDTLTELYNRQYFNDRLKKEISCSKRYKTSVSLIMFDVDRFKTINDTFGHMSGDKVLIEMSKLIRTNAREADVVARWGGEEFVVLVPQNDRQATILFAEKLRSKIASHSFSINQQVTCSFGVTQYGANESGGDFINRADQALYEAKKAGRNKVICK